MTNPNNAVGTNGAFVGRTSVNDFNDVLGAFQGPGILNGWAISPSSGMTVELGGSGLTRDVAVAEDNNGNRTTINNISGSPISITLDSAPASNSRYDAIVAYVDKPPTGSATQDNPECCGIIPVTGTAASTPAYPDDGAIRSAITADGASGATAYYVVLGYVLVASGTTTINSGMITAGGYAGIGNNQVNTNSVLDSAITSQKIDWATIVNAGYAYGPGSTVVMAGNSEICSGLITNSSKTAWITLIFPKPVYGATSVSITRLNGAFRGVNGQYIGGGSKDWVNKVTDVFFTGNIATASIDVEGETNLPTNNTPLSFFVQGGVTDTFS